MKTLKELAESLEALDNVQSELKVISTDCQNIKDIEIVVKIGASSYDVTSMVIPYDFINNLENQIQDQRGRLVQEIGDRL